MTGPVKEARMRALVAYHERETLDDIIQAFKICLPDCEIETTNSGQECIETVKSDCPDIVILNSNLHDHDCYDVLQQIRIYSRVPIIVLSFLKGEPDIVKSLELGADEYIVKPFRQLEFIAHVRALLRKGIKK